jgi:integrase
MKGKEPTIPANHSTFFFVGAVAQYELIRHCPPDLGMGVDNMEGNWLIDWEQRTVEVPASLLDLIEPLPRKDRWVFSTRTGNRYTHMWDDCNAIGKVAEIKGAHPHKFRATFATTLLQGGMDLKTVQKLLGHKNLESTMRYLAKAQSAEVRVKVNLIWK